jgi:hypothetical protein
MYAFPWPDWSGRFLDRWRVATLIPLYRQTTVQPNKNEDYDMRETGHSSSRSLGFAIGQSGIIIGGKDALGKRFSEARVET